MASEYLPDPKEDHFQKTFDEADHLRLGANIAFAAGYTDTSDELQRDALDKLSDAHKILSGKIQKLQDTRRTDNF